MNRFLRTARAHSAKAAVVTVTTTAGIVAAASVEVALATTFTLQGAKDATVTNQSGMTKSENIVVNSRGFAVYTLTGDSRSHPECTKANGCFSFWPPLTVSSPKKLSKAPGIKGRLGVWHRNGFFQVTLAGHPLYRYSLDTQGGRSELRRHLARRKCRRLDQRQRDPARNDALVMSVPAMHVRTGVDGCTEPPLVPLPARATGACSTDPAQHEEAWGHERPRVPRAHADARPAAHT
jgi:predicted lipoprotein with Yx(FWY)xxD motif